MTALLVAVSTLNSKRSSSASIGGSSRTVKINEVQHNNMNLVVRVVCFSNSHN